MARRDFVDGVHDRTLGDRVERRRGLVEDQEGRILEDCPGDGDPLFFAPREFEPTFANHRVVPVGRTADEIVESGEDRRLFDIGFGGFQSAVGDVVVERVVEQRDVLGNYAERVS